MYCNPLQSGISSCACGERKLKWRKMEFEKFVSCGRWGSYSLLSSRIMCSKCTCFISKLYSHLHFQWNTLLTCLVASCCVRRRFLQHAKTHSPIRSNRPPTRIKDIMRILYAEIPFVIWTKMRTEYISQFSMTKPCLWRTPFMFQPLERVSFNALDFNFLMDTQKIIDHNDSLWWNNALPRSISDLLSNN